MKPPKRQRRIMLTTELKTSFLTNSNNNTMNNLKNLETLLAKQGFVPLKETKEGLLRGGFAALSGGIDNNCKCDTLPNNCTCDNNNCGCPPSKVDNCPCGSNNCNCYKTAAVPTTAPKTTSTTLAPPKPAPGMGFVFGF